MRVYSSHFNVHLYSLFLNKNTDHMATPQKMYPKIKVRALEDDDECDQPEPEISLSCFVPDFTSPAKGSKHVSSPSVTKIRSHITRSITPPHALRIARKISELEADDTVRPHIRASSMPRPRAVISSPDNDQILGSKNRARSERLSVLENNKPTQSRRSEGKCTPAAGTTACKHSKRIADSKKTSHTIDAKGKKDTSLDVRVPRANIVKAKPCFTLT